MSTNEPVGELLRIQTKSAIRSDVDRMIGKSILLDLYLVQSLLSYFERCFPVTVLQWKAFDAGGPTRNFDHIKDYKSRELKPDQQLDVKYTMLSTDFSCSTVDH
ncbi:hypothetical protein FBUS_00504 [Fasciolopsis buskii]|uniref:Uncharacterized protein n=1 Tax=Fasciolopsis buskii TaxID=27845 RepID=A0A8E0RT07_9TREM|nr:hypothetical protein FBUS_00504 [Fasciolopsis buski]